MQTLTNRLRYLRSREALAAVALPAVIVGKWWGEGGEIAWGMRVAALSLLVYILVQGTLYWHLKLRSITGQAALPAYFSQVFCSFKWSNLMLAGGLLVLLFLPERMPLSDTDLRWTVGLLLGALLEHINYYHYQLMYDTRAAFDHLRRHGRLRKAALGIDMARARLTRIADGCER
ncbi:hypothetical protein SAMN05192549_11460 [Duganella sacchari]|uniref:Uncharacterized protein n=1 Tax=Duganella sacchari TaxID=551987 RepID=A0A1M7R860_9BURK|nr:hypothetical protein [Duganella sacchari]SHN42436.1 hypothetical protein SAMN05192549_11460 [Duganella sacchari]